VNLNRRTLLASLGLALPAFGAEAATTAHKKKKPLHASKPSGVKTASAKSHHKSHPHPASATSTQS
jgi:hypothetical protein